jgi:hypothetical protein
MQDIAKSRDKIVSNKQDIASNNKPIAARGTVQLNFIHYSLALLKKLLIKSKIIPTFNIVR